MKIVEKRDISKSVFLSAKDVVDMWNNYNPKNRAPENASVTFHVPGGGDWSNRDVDVDDFNHVKLSWSEQ